MSTKKDQKLAYEAGLRAFHTEPPERRHPDACPFEPGTDERQAWLEGFAGALDEAPDVAELKKAVKAARA